MSIKEIITAMNKFPCKHVCITGGEPLVQKGIVEFIQILLNKKYAICLETNGSITIEPVTHWEDVLISLDIKCPSSNMHEKMHMENVSLLRNNDQLKFVINNREDYDYAKEIIQKHQPVCTVFFQPVWMFSAKQLAQWILNDGLQVKLGLQIHKIVWGDRRGV
jgi:7-carboxy-7-deazaguanine synthase